MSKTILITGTSAGFGKIMAIDLAKKGYNVAAGMRNVSSKNAEVAKELSALPNVIVVEMDVTSTDSVNTAVEQTVAKFGGIDVLVNNAGIAGYGLFEAFSVEQMKRLFEVNLWGTVRGYLAVLPLMREQRSGLIINITSGLGIISAPYIAPYTGTKYAIEGMTETIRYEVQNFGIETVTLQPGPFRTGITEKEGAQPDRTEIYEAYGEGFTDKLQKLGGIMSGKMDEYAMDPQEVSDATINLIEMEPGTRPYYTVVNRVTDNLEQEYADSKDPIRKEWMKRMGWGEWL
ncbi:SDR family oxidoreductase [Mucilaginibacter lutimaris]|uniref:SDR family oxidoreductase n=1 Tax=Mucilaginibacter lutimaris TaxID=931629 RepID=A0ABW2ZB04_9SPHI